MPKAPQYVYLIVIDNHNSDPEYIICGSEKAADRIMEETIKDRYIGCIDADTEADISNAVSDGFYESEMGDMIIMIKEIVHN